MKRSGKFYRRNEAEAMQMLGLQPTANSGSGWIEKEDGQSEDLLCQLKSTDAQSIRVQKKDIDTLEYNATVSHKLPVFAIQFLESDDVYLIMRPADVKDIANALEGKQAETGRFLEIADAEDVQQAAQKKIKSSSQAREELSDENERKFKKEVKKAL